jgi:hypothetical protein
MQVQLVSSGHRAERAPSRGGYEVEEVTFRKTIAGHHEFEHRRVLNRAELRRLLILIDGKRSVDSLVSYFRAFELAGLIDELLALGMIEPISSDLGLSPVTLSEALGNQSALKPNQFEAARRAAMHGASELLGMQARQYCAQLVMCQDSMALRAVLCKIRTALDSKLGEDAATLFIESVRDAVKVSR